jgi:hypothetical protein
MAESRAPIEASTLATDPVVPDAPPQAPDLRQFLIELLSAEDPAHQTRAAGVFSSGRNVFPRVAEVGVTDLALRAAEHLPQGQMLGVGAQLLQLPQGCEDILRSGDAEELRAALNMANRLPRQRAIGHLLSEQRCRALQVAGRSQADALLDQALGHLPPEQRAPISAWLGRPVQPLKYQDVLASVAARAGLPIQDRPVPSP